MTNRKILILYASYGDGHIQVSRALKERFEAEEAPCEAVLVDLFAEAYPFLNELTKYIYIKSYSLFPGLYGWTYNRTRFMRSGTPFSNWFHSWGMAELKRILQKDQPDCVINTFPMLAMPELKKKTGLHLPVFHVITDFTLHSRWIHPFVDKYYVACDDIKAQLAASGIPETRIEATGIPLKRDFRVIPRSPELYRKYGLNPDRRTVLIMAGSYGVLPGLGDICARLTGIPDTQLVLVCGKNRPLFEAMNEALKGEANAKVFGFVQEMNELMAVADAMVTKPGGITLTESIQYELPVVLFRPVPGQENDNALYLASKKAAFISRDETDLTKMIGKLLTDPHWIAETKKNISALRKPDSAEAVVRDILHTLELTHRMDGMPSIDRRRVASERFP